MADFLPGTRSALMGLIQQKRFEQSTAGQLQQEQLLQQQEQRQRQTAMVEALSNAPNADAVFNILKTTNPLAYAQHRLAKEEQQAQIASLAGLGITGATPGTAGDVLKQQLGTQVSEPIAKETYTREQQGRIDLGAQKITGQKDVVELQGTIEKQITQLKETGAWKRLNKSEQAQFRRLALKIKGDLGLVREKGRVQQILQTGDIESREEMAKEALAQDFNKFQTGLQFKEESQLRDIDHQLVLQENDLEGKLGLLKAQFAGKATAAQQEQINALELQLQDNKAKRARLGSELEFKGKALAQDESQFVRTLDFKKQQLDTDVNSLMKKLNLNEKQFEEQMGFNREKLAQDRQLFIQDAEMEQAQAIHKRQAKVLPQLANIANITSDVLSAFESYSEIPDNIKGPIEGRTKGVHARVFKRNEALTTYERFKSFITANISRQLGGERGVLTDADVERVEKLLPDLTDTNKSAKGAIKEVLSFIDRRVKTKQEEAGLEQTGLGFDIEKRANQLSGISSTRIDTTTPRTDADDFLDDMGR